MSHHLMAPRIPRTGAAQLPPGSICIFVRCSRGDYKEVVTPSTTIGEIKKRMVPKVAAEPKDQQLTYGGRFLMDDQTLRECLVGGYSTLNLQVDQKMRLCPKGSEQEGMQTGVPLDTDFQLYINRLAHSGALNKLVDHIRRGEVDSSELFSVRADGGTAVVGLLAFDSVTHILSFKPLAMLEPSTLHTVTVKSNLMLVKNEIADLGPLRDARGRAVADLLRFLDYPEYTFTFTTATSAWRQLSLRLRYEDQAMPSSAAAFHELTIAAHVTLKNDDELFVGLQALCVQALPGNLDEDEDILSIHSVEILSGSSQLVEVAQSNMSALAHGGSLLVTLKAQAVPEEPTEAALQPSPKRPRVDGGATQPGPQVGAEGTGALSPAPAPVPALGPAPVAEALAFVPASSGPGGGKVAAFEVGAQTALASATPRQRRRERLTELKELLEAGLISSQDFEDNKKQILAEI